MDTWRNGRKTVPKLCGADVELGNFVRGERGGRPPAAGTGALAARLLLREFRGLPGLAPAPAAPTSATDEPRTASADTRGRPGDGDPRDQGRKFLPANGGCAYIDLDHLEVCIPEVRSAFDHVAAWHAMLRIARDALDAANARITAERRVVVLVNNSDGMGNSYGGHLSFLIERRAWENIVDRRLDHLLFLASYQASAIVFAGAGKVGSENGRGPVPFQISQRADFVETICGPQTTYARPIVNSRDESLTGRDRGTARLHCIFFDSGLCHVSSLLKVGATQIVLAMLEQDEVPIGALLEDPLEALLAWSRDPDLRATAALLCGGRATAVDAQWRVLEHAGRFVAEGRADGIVPRAQEIVSLWEEVLAGLERDPRSMATHIDWVLKRAALERARERHGLAPGAPQLKHLDHLYGSLAVDEGLYWAYERAGAVRRVVSDARIERLVHEPPEDTRAWTRARLLRAAGPRVDEVDWDEIRFRTRDPFAWPRLRTLEMSDPLGFGRERAERAFRGASDLDELLDSLEADGAEAQRVRVERDK